MLAQVDQGRLGFYFPHPPLPINGYTCTLSRRHVWLIPTCASVWPERPCPVLYCPLQAWFEPGIFGCQAAQKRFDAAGSLGELSLVKGTATLSRALPLPSAIAVLANAAPANAAGWVGSSLLQGPCLALRHPDDLQRGRVVPFPFDRYLPAAQSLSGRPRVTPLACCMWFFVRSL